MKPHLAFDVGQELAPDLRGYHYPDRSAAAEIRSLAVQSKMRLELIGEKGVTAEEMHKAVKAVRSIAPTVAVLTELESFRSEIRAGMAKVNPKSSPGLPYAVLYRTNADLFANEGEECLLHLVLARLQKIVLAEDEVFEESDAVAFVRLGLCDPVRMFIKNELHTTKKVLAGRYRQIFSVSLVDQLVERALTGRLQMKEIDMWREIPAKPGMGLHDGGLKALWALFQAFKRAMGTDVKGWDWGFTFQLFLMVAALRTLQHGEVPKTCGFGGEHFSLWEKRSIMLSLSVVVSSDGWAFVQVLRWLMKSGAYWTSANNSWGRTLEAVIAKARAGGGSADVAAMGDDCVEDVGDVELGALLQAYKELGVRIKEHEVLDCGKDDVRGEIEFCSYRFAYGPEYAERPFWPAKPEHLVASHLYGWAPGAPQELRLQIENALTYELRHCPNKGEWLATAAAAREGAMERFNRAVAQKAQVKPLSGGGNQQPNALPTMQF